MIIKDKNGHQGFFCDNTECGLQCFPFAPQAFDNIWVNNLIFCGPSCLRTTNVKCLNKNNKLAVIKILRKMGLTTEEIKTIFRGNQ